MSHADVYQQVTDRMITALEQGTVPWRKPWTTAGRPRSMSTGNAYRGVNVFLLGLTAQESGYSSPFWGTYRQITELGGQVRQCEKSTGVTFWKELHVEDRETGKPVKIPMLRQFRVFNASQADDLPTRFYPEPGDATTITAPQDVINAYLASGNAAGMTHDVHGQAYYSPAADEIHLPPLAEHRSPADYYSTAFHEIAHSTGHESRLNRPGVSSADATFGSHAYGREELAAQMASSMLCAETGTDTDAVFSNSAAYIASWLHTIKSDKKLVISAAAAGQKAADLVLSASDTDTEAAA